MTGSGGRRAKGGRSPDGDILLECRVLGNQMRVAAIDAATGVEVTLVVPAKLSQADIAILARRKLARRMEREAPAPESRPGRLV